MTGAVLEAVGRKDESKLSSSGLEMHKALWAGLASHGCNDTEALPLVLMGLLPLLLAGMCVSWAAHCSCGAVLNRKTWET